MERDVRFIILKTPEGNNDILDALTKSLRDSSRNVRSMNVKNVLALKTLSDKDIFVCESFCGESFEKLASRTNRILGPPAVSYSLKNDAALPDCSEHPVYSQCMSGVLVCITSIEPVQRQELHQKLHLMNGASSRSLTNLVTHIVTGNVAKVSPKYRVALEMGTPIMSVDWIEQCFKSDNNDLSALDPEVVKKYRQPILGGCLVCVTGIEQNERERIEKLVNANGGEYSPNLTPVCSHLIAMKDGPRSTKFEFAEKWGVLIVTPDWLQECQKLGGIAEETNFLVQSSEQAGADGLTLKERSLDFHKVQQKKFLEGVRLYLAGFSGPRSKLMMQISRVGRAVRLKTLTDMVTHIIASKELPEQMLDDLRKHRKPVLMSDWLVECCNQGALVPTDKFLLTEPTPVSTNKRKRRRGQPPLQEQETPGPQSDVITAEEKAKELRRPAVFKGMKFYICHPPFAEQHVGPLTQKIEACGGTAARVPGDADLCVYPFSRRRSQPMVAPAGVVLSECVTELYLERCAEDAIRFDRMDHLFFRPLLMKLPIEGFELVSVCMSAFDELEKAALIEFCTLIGAKVSHQLKRGKVTHLICAKPGTSKMKSALQWGGVHVVTKEWLLDSVVQRKLLEPSAYPVTPAMLLVQSSIPDSAEKNPDKSSSEKKPGTEPSPSSGFKNPFADGLRDEDALADFASPAPKTKAAASSPATGTPELVGAMGAGLSKACAATTRPSVFPSSVAIHVIAELLQGAWTHLPSLIKELGATYKSTWDSTCTHLVHSGKSGESPAVLRSARGKDNIHLVSPHWVVECNTSGKHESESLFPLSYNPKMNLTMAASPVVATSGRVSTPSTGRRSPALKRRSPASSVSSSKRSRTTTPKKRSSPKTKTNSQQEASSALLEGEVSKMLAMATSVAAASGQRIATRRASAAPTPPPTSDSTFFSLSKMEREQSRRSSTDYRDDEDMDVDCSQVAVTYDDPGRDERARILAKLKRQDTGDSEPAEAEPTPTPLSRHEPYVTTNSSSAFSSRSTRVTEQLSPRSLIVAKRDHKFLLSAFSEDRKRRLKQVICQLGGEYLETSQFSKSCTHVVVGTPSRSEKYLAACAAGRWILKEGFLHASLKEKTFVDEEPYEWGPSDDLKDAENLCAAAAPRWRKRLQLTSASSSGPTGAFSGWRCVLWLEAKVQASFERLLQAGGAELIERVQDLSAEEVGQITHIFVHKLRLPDMPEEIRALAKQGVPSLTPDYIGAFLQGDTPPLPANFCVDITALDTEDTTAGARRSKRARHA